MNIHFDVFNHFEFFIITCNTNTEQIYLFNVYHSTKAVDYYVCLDYVLFITVNISYKHLSFKFGELLGYYF